MKALRKELSADFILSASSAIKRNLLTQLERFQTIMLYLSAFNEPDTHSIIQELLRLDKTIAVPISHTDDFTIVPSRLSSLDGLKKGAYGIYEPVEETPIPISDIDAVVIPGVVFDLHGSRLGFGKGYYDRFLEHFQGLKIGICYDFQIIDNLPCDLHDIKMDLIITEKRMYNDF